MAFRSGLFCGWGTRLPFIENTSIIGNQSGKSILLALCGVIGIAFNKDDKRKRSEFVETDDFLSGKGLFGCFLLQ